MYVLYTGPQGKLSAIENIDGGTIFEPNPTLREYQEMLRWIRDNLTPPVNLQEPLPDETKLFLSRHALATHCRRRGLLLYANKKEIPYWNESQHAGVRLYYLSVAYSRSEADDAPDSETGIVAHTTNFAVPESEWTNINVDLDNEDSAIRHVSSLPINLAFVYLDVSDFSMYKAGEQALIINSLSAIVSDQTIWTGRAKSVYRKFKTMLCIGDGYIFVFDEPVKATFFAGYLAQLIEVLVANNLLPVEFHFRMGAHVGPVYSFWDSGRDRWNYVGDGINGGNRVLAAVGKDQDDVIFISSDVRKEIQASQSDTFDLRVMLGCLTNRGRKQDKHGNAWRVYELNHTQLCANDIPDRPQESIHLGRAK
jgi:class 3 adenylate cyclase